MELTPFEILIKEQCGLFFDGNRREHLLKSLGVRMKRNGMSSSTQYWHALANNPEEMRELVMLLTINESYFFREINQLKLFSEQLFPDILSKKKAGEKVRILSAGCSTGEEPFSLVMSLMEKYGSGVGKLITVIGTDIDRYVIQEAKKGTYGRKSFRGLSPDLLSKYFNKVDKHHYQICDLVRKQVEFSSVNLLQNDGLAIFGNFDIIFYRNVSIYFDALTRRKVFTILASFLDKDGGIVMSSVEVAHHDFGCLALIEKEGQFYFSKNFVANVSKKKVLQEPPKLAKEKPDCLVFRYRVDPFRRLSRLSRLSEDIDSRSFLTTRKKSSLKDDASDSLETTVPTKKTTDDQRRGNAHLFDEGLSLAMSKQYDLAMKCLTQLLKQDPSNVRAAALKAGIFVETNQLAEAEKCCVEVIEMDEWNLEAVLLLGIIARRENRIDAALKRFREAIYLNASCWLAHYYLAEVYRSRNAKKPAMQEYKAVLRLLEEGHLGDHGLTLFSVSYSKAEMRRLCHSHLALLK